MEEELSAPSPNHDSLSHLMFDRKSSRRAKGCVGEDEAA